MADVPLNVRMGVTGETAVTRSMNSVSNEAARLHKTVDRTLATTRQTSAAFSSLAMVSPRLSTAFFAVQEAIDKANGSLKSFTTAIIGGAAFAGISFAIQHTIDKFKELRQAQEDMFKAGADSPEAKQFASFWGNMSNIGRDLVGRALGFNIGGQAGNTLYMAPNQTAIQAAANDERVRNRKRYMDALRGKSTAERVLDEFEAGGRPFSVEEYVAAVRYAENTEKEESTRASRFTADKASAAGILRRIQSARGRVTSTEAIQFASAATFGSQEAFQAAARAKAGYTTQTVDKQQLDELRTLVAEFRKFPSEIQLAAQSEVTPI